MAITQDLCAYDNKLYAVWKGETGDDRLFYSFFNGQSWTKQQAAPGNTSAGPCAAKYGDRMFLGWKGEHDDPRLFWLTVAGGLWSQQAEIPGVGSSIGPSMAEFNGRLYAAWKGKGADEAIWYASYDGSSWSGQQRIPNVGTIIGPSLCVYNGRLYAAWRGMNNDQAIWYSWFDGSTWAPQAKVPGVASLFGPSLATFEGKLYAAWKGMNDDVAIWYSAFDGTSWTAQRTIPGVGSSIGPALAEYAGHLYAMWKGKGNDQRLWYSSYDGTNWAPQAQLGGNTGQDLPINIGLRMQYQETTEWCWLAVGASVAYYYTCASSKTQSELMTQIGRDVNKWVGVDCSPTAAMYKANPGLTSALANPYDKPAEYCLETVGIPQQCIKSGGVATVLDVCGNDGGSRSSLSLGEVTAEVDAGRPVVADIAWKNGGQHFIAIAGVLNDEVLILDPINGETIMRFEDFPAGYQGGATLFTWNLTKSK